MSYDVYDSHPPRITTWVIEDPSELAEVLRIVQSDTEHRYWFNRAYPEPRDKEAPLPVERLKVDLDDLDDAELFFEEKDAIGTVRRVTVATGSCCVTTSSNGSAYISFYRLYSWAMPSFLFHPELRPIL